MLGATTKHAATGISRVSYFLITITMDIYYCFFTFHLFSSLFFCFCVAINVWKSNTQVGETEEKTFIHECIILSRQFFLFNNNFLFFCTNFSGRFLELVD